jgi:rare lipoprotein A (peptidoglycan hydrolase)
LLRRIINNSIFILLVFLFWSCSSVPRFTSDDPHPSRPKADRPARDIGTKSEVENTDLTEFHNVSVLETETGIASFYGENFDGNLTSNGEIFDMYGISAAHPKYPSGTIVRVTNLSNNVSEILRINDHMPQHPERIIDLSYGAAKKLDMVVDGLVEIRVEVLKWGDGQYKKQQ